MSYLCLHKNNSNTRVLSDDLYIHRSKFKDTLNYSKEWFSGYGLNKDGKKTDTFPLNYEINQDKLLYQPTTGTIMVLLNSSLAGFGLKRTDAAVLLSKKNRFEFTNIDQPDMNYVHVYIY